MSKRMRSAVIAVAVLCAGAFVSFDNAEARSRGGASASRSCLTSSARNLLARIEARFGTMQVISTCRPGARIAGTGRISKHASGNAVDFNAGRQKGAVLNWLIANHKSGGIMTYPRMSHIHVDIGPRFVSLSGSRTRYAGNRSRRGKMIASASSRKWSKQLMAVGGPRRHQH